MSTRSGRPGFLVLRYEDMIENPARELVKVANLPGNDPSPERCQRRADLNSADRMRKLEEKQGDRVGSNSASTRQDKPLVPPASSAADAKPSSLPNP